MLYELDVTAPANTPATAPEEVELVVVKGVVVKVEVQIPSGPMGLVRAQIFRAGHQLWPSNDGEYFKGDGWIVSWPENYEMADEPLRLTFRVWNLDDTYEHTLTFRVAMVPLAQAEEVRGLPGLFRRLAAAVLGDS